MNSNPVFQHCLRCGAAGFRTPDGKVYVCDACGLHFYKNITTAVAGLVVDPADRLLLICRAREPAKGKLAYPGGFIDAGETAEQALRREIFEEVGLQVSGLEFLTSAPNLYRYRDVDYDVLDLFFVCRVPSFEGALAKEEVAHLSVRPAAELDPAELAFPSMRQAFAEFCRGRTR